MLRIRTATSSALVAVQRKFDRATEFESVPCGSLKYLRLDQKTFDAIRQWAFRACPTGTGRTN